MPGSFFYSGISPDAAGIILIPDSAGPMTPGHGMVYAEQRSPDDPIGAFTLRLVNAVAGSRFRIERAGDGSVAEPSAAAEGDISTDPQDLTLYLYVAGNPNNNLRIKVRKGTSAPKYQPFETQALAGPGVVTAYIAQVVDPIA